MTWLRKLLESVDSISQLFELGTVAWGDCGSILSNDRNSLVQKVFLMLHACDILYCGKNVSVRFLR